MNLAAPSRSPSDPTSSPAVVPRAGRPLLVLHLRGDQRVLGRQHGELLREAGGFEEAVAFYPEMPERVIGLRDRLPGWAQPPVRGLLSAALARLEARRPAPLLARSRAFCEALGLGGDFARHLMVMDLLQNVVGVAGRFGHGVSKELAFRAAIPACSSLVVWGEASRGGALRHARNFDFPGVGVWERQPTVVFCTPDEGPRYGFVTTRGADVPGITAFNEAGLSITAHTCFHRHVRFDGRAIVDLTHEIVRRARTLEEALRIARERPVASSWTLVVSSATERRAIAIETNGRRVEATEPREGEPFLANANRYRHPALRRGQVAPAAGFIANSDARYAVLRALAEQGRARGGMSVEDLQAALADRSDPEVPGVRRAAGGVVGNALGVQSVVIDPEERAVHVSTGPSPTGGGPWVTVPWSWEEPTGAQVIEPATAADSTTLGPCDDPGLVAFVEAVAHEGRRDHPAMAEALARAAAADPTETGYRLLLGGVRLHQGDPVAALSELRAGLEHERGSFQRAQLLLWASRAAIVTGATKEAAALRSELAGLEHPLIADYQRDALREGRRPLGARRLRRAEVNLTFPDVMLA